MWCQGTASREGEAPAEPPLCIREQNDVLWEALDRRSLGSRRWICDGPNACLGCPRRRIQFDILVRLGAERCPLGRFVAVVRTTAAHGDVRPPIASDFVPSRGLVGGYTLVPATSGVEEPCHGRARLLPSPHCAFESKSTYSGKRSTDVPSEVAAGFATAPTRVRGVHDVGFHSIIWLRWVQSAAQRAVLGGCTHTGGT